MTNAARSIAVIFAILFAAALAISPLEAQAEADDRLNVVFLVADDQRFDTLGCYGNSIIQTPNIDALAAEGVRFANCFATTSICATSRANLITGQYASRNGVWTFQKTFSPEAYAETLPMQLKSAGYRVGFIGKWGIGDPKGWADESFDFWGGFPGQGNYYPKSDYDLSDPRPESLQTLKGPHLTETMESQAVEFLDGCSADEPFFLQVSFKAAHCQDGARWQFPCEKRYEDLYADTEIPLPETANEQAFATLPECVQKSEARTRWHLRFEGEEFAQQTLKDYYRLITGIDRVVGTIREKLAEKGVAEKTLIVYVSDNGFYLGDYGLAGKWFAHEPSIRLPLIVYDPRLSNDRRGAVANETVLTIDVAPLILDSVGLSIPESMQGVSLRPCLLGEAKNWRTDFLYEHLLPIRTIPKCEGVRESRFKYVRYLLEGETIETLTDLQNDPHELTNLVDEPEHAATLRRMRLRLEELKSMASSPIASDVSAVAP